MEQWLLFRGFDNGIYKFLLFSAENLVGLGKGSLFLILCLHTIKLKIASQNIFDSVLLNIFLLGYSWLLFQAL